MTIAITMLIALLGVYLDYKAYRRVKSGSAGKFVKYAFLSVIGISYLLILVTPLLMYFFVGVENCGYMMKLSMILFTTYLTLSIPRLFFYLFFLPANKKCWMWIGSAVSAFLLLAMLYSIFITRTDYKINKVDICCDNLPVSFNNYRIAFISDIHTGSMICAERELMEIAEMVDDANVDVLFFGGDIINLYHHEIDDSLLDDFSRLKARDGVYMVFGNHDTGAYIKGLDKGGREANMALLESKMESAGWVVLRDSTVYIERGKDSIAVTGIDYNDTLLKYKHSMDAVNGVDITHIYNNVHGSLFNITLSHLPQLWHSLSDGGYSDLVLSGHIHAMQMKIGSFSPAGYMYKEWSGLYESENGKLYINDGIGCVGYLMRIGARPEITVIELYSKK